MRKQDDVLGAPAEAVGLSGSPLRSGPDDGTSPTIPSAATDLVMALDHPPPEEGGPCATCAFRRGTEANTFDLTQKLVRLCVEGGRLFRCHEKKQLCRGYIAAMNVRGTEDLDSDKAKIHGHVADWLAEEIDRRVSGRSGAEGGSSRSENGTREARDPKGDAQGSPFLTTK